ncbi:MAG: NFACT family protein [Bacilli bacterium]|nr:NFACT family protein [Bacilli bacterium]
MILSMNNYSYSVFKIIVDELKKKIVGCKINNITVINSHDFLCSLSMIKNEKLLISLNHQHPFLSLISVNEVAPTIVGKLNELLRKVLKDAYIVDISLINEDRIVLFKMQKANEYYEKESFDVYLECIPQRANLVFVDAEGIIKHALHYSPLTSNRPILNNLKYEAPLQSSPLKEEDAPALEEIKKAAEKYYLDALNVHKKEKFTPLYRYIKTRIKSLNKKSLVLEKEIKEAEIHLKDVEHGNTLLAYFSEPELLEQYISDNNLLLNKDISIVDNANQFFKKYKKSKRTIEMANIEINKAKEESDYLSYLLASSQYMNDDELLSLSMELLPKQSQKKKSLPIKYGTIVYEGTKILYGKNASSNNELTFKVATKDDYYLHIKDYHGAHIIIKDNNPSNNVKLVAAELCLILSNKDAGEVMITSMKNVKKGHALGEANLLNYSTIVLNEVRSETKELLFK